MSNLVSPCCGDEYTDNTDGTSYCCDAPIESGICQNKDCLDHAEPQEGFICENCEEFFEEPELDYEYAERQHDSYLEDRMDAERDER
jgi:hypothetical protein|tara:strand:+ start:400 stop:660 length:261 start_codon:yes stop_codon:yes gene_type:complete